MESLLIFALTGAGAGVLAGLFGVGGGLIMVPALAFVLARQHTAPEVIMQVAIATSLAVISVTSISSARAHYLRKSVRLDLLKTLAPSMAFGALAGAFIAHILPSHTLKIFVGIGALAVALKMFLERPKPHDASACVKLPRTGELIFAGSLIGLLSSLVGIGGGSLTVPYLNARKFSMTQAVGTAAAGGIPIAWGGMLGFIISGWNVTNLPPHHLGYISLPAFIGLAVFSVFTAPFGAKLAHQLSATTLKRAFAVLLSVVGVMMLWG